MGGHRLGPARWTSTDRRGGSSRAPFDGNNLAAHVGDDPATVAANRAAVAGAFGVREMAVVTAEHGARVRLVGQAGPAGPGDVLVTTTPGLALLALGADCAMVALVAPDVPAVAVVHSGWRGAAADAPGVAVQALQELGADPGLVSARIGPAICQRCYEVSAEVALAVDAAAPGSAQEVGGGWRVDIPGAVAVQLRRAGVVDIGADPRCTFEDPALFSHRRDARTGRQGLLVVLEDA
jgi:YfiH family protein